MDKQRRFQQRIPFGGPFIPSTVILAETVEGCRRGYEASYKTYQALREEHRELTRLCGEEDITENIDHPDDVDFSKMAAGGHAKVVADLTLGVWQTVEECKGDVALVDSLFLTFCYPGFLGDISQLASLYGAYENGSSSLRPFLRRWVEITAKYPLGPLEILRAAVTPLSIPTWGRRRLRGARGPGKQPIERVRTWGHILVAEVLGEQLSALKFWCEYRNENPKVADLTYSTPTQDPCSERAHSALIMAKRRLGDDLAAAGILPFKV